MKFKSILSRLTGISTPVFGISWQPPEADIDAAARIVAFLEDRRVLYVPSEVEVPAHCVASLLEIRAFLTAEIGKGRLGQPLEESLRAMRVSCRRFLDVAEAADGRYGWDVHAYRPGHSAQWDFDSALGQLRGVFGIHIARIAAAYGLDVEDDLATILPGEDEPSDDED